MDIFGIGTAIKGMLGVHRLASRGTGRTLMMVESLKPGDRVWFAGTRERDRVERMLRDRGIEGVELLVSDPNPARWGLMFERGSARGKVLFDHTWVEIYYGDAVEAAIRQLNHITQETSHADGMGKSHITTRKQAEEHQRWKAYLPGDEP